MISIDDLLAFNVLPDALIRIGIRNLLAQKLREETRENAVAQGEALSAFVEELKRSPIAVKTAAANEQHYEVPTEFFKLVLGPRMKYSSGYWSGEHTTFAESEEAMLALSCERAELANGQDILELGCGWLKNIPTPASRGYPIPRHKKSISKTKQRAEDLQTSAS